MSLHYDSYASALSSGSDTSTQYVICHQKYLFQGNYHYLLKKRSPKSQWIHPVNVHFCSHQVPPCKLGSSSPIGGIRLLHHLLILQFQLLKKAYGSLSWMFQRQTGHVTHSFFTHPPSHGPLSLQGNQEMQSSPRIG